MEETKDEVLMRPVDVGSQKRTSWSISLLDTMTLSTSGVNALRNFWYERPLPADSRPPWSVSVLYALWKACDFSCSLSPTRMYISCTSCSFDLYGGDAFSRSRCASLRVPCVVGPSRLNSRAPRVASSAPRVPPTVCGRRREEAVWSSNVLSGRTRGSTECDCENIDPARFVAASCCAR